MSRRELHRTTAAETLMEEARRHVEAATSPQDRNVRKAEVYAYLYGNPLPLKEAITLPHRDVKEKRRAEEG